MNEYPRISVIVPVYNGEKYIDNFMSQYLEQKYSNLELVIVNDGSVDNTLEILRKYINKVSNIKVHSQKNQGPSVARNKGIRLSTGEYVIFADIDDYLYPDYVSRLYELIVETDADVAFGNYKKVSKINNKAITQNNILNSNILEFDNKEALNDFNYRRHLTGYSYLKLIKKSILNEINFPEDIVYGEDFVFTYNLLKKVRKVVYSEKICYLYFQNIESATHIKRDNTKKYQDAWRAHMNYLDDVKEKYPNLSKGAIAKCYLLAINNTTRIFDKKRDIDFLNELYLFVKENAKVVYMDYESKKIVRILGLLGMVSPKCVCVICKCMFDLMERTHITLRRTI